MPNAAILLERQTTEAERIGIEPISQSKLWRNGFEDRGGHQALVTLQIPPLGCSMPLDGRLLAEGSSSEGQRLYRLPLWRGQVSALGLTPLPETAAN